MMMLECDAKRLLASVGVAVPAGAQWRRGEPASSVKVAAYPVAVKAQVRSGGRGKQGGVVKVADAAALAAAGAKLFATELRSTAVPKVMSFCIRRRAASISKRARRRCAIRSGRRGISACTNCVRSSRKSNPIINGAKK